MNYQPVVVVALTKLCSGKSSNLINSNDGALIITRHRRDQIP